MLLFPLFLLPSQSLQPLLKETSGLPSELTAESAILIAWDTAQILYEKNAYQVHSLASLSKLMTIYLALEASVRGDFDLEGEVVLSSESYASNQPPGSSLMFLGPHQRVSGMDLLRGLAVSSGNDAAVAVAIALSGNVPAFVQKMNETARDLGYWSMHFADPAGLDPGNVANSGDLASFASRLIASWDEMIPQLFALKKFVYPQQHHQLGATSIVQYNRNSLLWDYPGADGLKTGYTEESGYTLIATAKRNDERLIAVLLSVPGKTTAEGSRNRHSDAKILFDYGFNGFSTRPLPDITSHVLILGGRYSMAEVQPLYSPPFTLRKEDHQRIMVEIVPTEPLWAPLESGDRVGKIIYSLDNQILAIVPLISSIGVIKSGMINRLSDWMSYKFLRNR